MHREDPEFFARADAHIRLSNAQIAPQVGRGQVSASMLYAAARFNAWLSACGFPNGASMAESRTESIAYFVEQYRLMLEENFDDYSANFEKYMKSRAHDV